MNAFNIIKSDDGLSYRIEWDVHYITDEQIGTIGAYVGALQEENERLRDLCKLFSEYISPDSCEGCLCKSKCDKGEINECWQHAEIRKASHELGMEVKS